MSTLDRALIKAYSPYRRGAAAQERPAGGSPPLRARAERASVAAPAGGEKSLEADAAIGAGESRATLAMHPLSTFQAQPPRVDRKSAGAFRPALEVSAFAWPGQCESLLARIPSGWQTFAQDVLQRGETLVAVASRRAGEGCTTTALCLARQLVAQGLRIVLVDADFEKPDLARRLGVAPQDGWEAVASGRLTLADVLIDSVDDRLVLLPWKKTDANKIPDLSHSNVTAAFDTLRENYDLVLLDSGAVDPNLGPWLRGAAATRLGGLYVVYDGRRDSSKKLDELVTRMDERGTSVTALIENFAAAPVSPRLNLTSVQ